MSGELDRRQGLQGSTQAVRGLPASRPLPIDKRRGVVSASLHIGNPANNARDLTEAPGLERECQIELRLEEIREYDVDRLSKSEKLEVERLVRRLHDAGYASIEPLSMGYFFGSKALVAAADRSGVAGIAVADFDEIAYFPRRHSRRPLGPAECYSIYKGRRLLKSFNPQGGP